MRYKVSKIRWRSSGNKYGARKVKLDGYTFDSQGEMRRYQELKLLEKQGLIWGLMIYPHFDLTVEGQQICKYIADFGYSDNRGYHVEDFKGVLTPIFRLKRKLFKATLGFDIDIVTANKRRK